MPGDLLRFQDASALADVELDDLRRLLLEHLGELEPVDQTLAGRDGMFVWAATRAISSTFSGGTGSSKK